MESSRKSATGKVPTLNTNILDETGQLRPLTQHLGRSQYLAPVLRQSPTCAHPKASHGCNRDWSWTKCEACGAIEQILKLTPDRVTEWNTVLVYQKPTYVTPQAKKQAKEAKKTGTTTATSSTTRSTPTFGEHLRQTASSARLTARAAAASTAKASDQRSEGPMLPTMAVEPPLHPPRLGRDAAMEVDQQEYEIGAPDSQAIPPPTLAEDWEHDREMMEDALNLLMPGTAPTRSCARCSEGQLVLNWHEDTSGYVRGAARTASSVPGGGPEATPASRPVGVEVPELSRSDLDVRCDGQLSAFWGIQPGQDAPMDGTWEPVGGLEEEHAPLMRSACPSKAWRCWLLWSSRPTAMFGLLRAGRSQNQECDGKVTSSSASDL